MSIESELLEIKGDSELLVVDDVIAWARNHPNSELHRQYNWNINEAAMEHWRWQTRKIIAIHITYQDGHRRFISLSIDRIKQGGGYRAMDAVANVPDLREIMLSDALAELKRMEIKYNYLVELSEVWKSAEKARRKRGRPPKQAQLSSAESSRVKPSPARLA